MRSGVALRVRIQVHRMDGWIERRLRSFLAKKWRALFCSCLERPRSSSMTRMRSSGQPSSRALPVSAYWRSVDSRLCSTCAAGGSSQQDRARVNRQVLREAVAPRGRGRKEIRTARSQPRPRAVRASRHGPDDHAATGCSTCTGGQHRRAGPANATGQCQGTGKETSSWALGSSAIGTLVEL